MIHEFFKQPHTIGAMEREPISKNRVSPKNDRSKENKMNRENLIFIFLLKFIKMKKSFLLMMTAAALSAGYAQSSQTYGFDWNRNISSYGKGHFVVTHTMPYFPAWHSELHQYDVILRINDIKTSTMKTLPDVIQTMEVRRLGEHEPIKITMQQPVDYPGNSLSERELVTKLSINHSFVSCDFADKYVKIDVYIDPEADLMNFCTFDFEYTNEKNPAFEKEVASSVQRYLEEYKGLRRDKENPDMLIFINFYTGTKENYVTPQTNLTTRYRTEYNVWTKQRESRQYIESHTSGGYTITKYLYLVQLSFLDAKAAQTQNKVAPVIWRADFEKEYAQEQNSLNFADNACWELIDYGYPYKKIGRYYFPSLYLEDTREDPTRNITFLAWNSYWFTGLSFNSNNLQEITFVAEGSPADKAGIKAGDIVTKINGTAISKNLKKWAVLSHGELRRQGDYTIYFEPVKKPVFDYLSIGSTTDSQRQGANRIVNFEIKRGKQKLKITVLAEQFFAYWR
jgi:hypothetical protein